MTNISVIGAGTMGNGIAHVFAQGGFNVTIVDIKKEVLDAAIKTIERNLDRQVVKERITENQKNETLRRIKLSTVISEGVKNADLVIEAATEAFELKKKIFQEVDINAPKTAILASNTSSISITKLASTTSNPSRVIGMHFMNPVPIMKLVEVIRGYSTSDEVCKSVKETSEKLGKIPVEVNDYPGFVANRILMPMINEAIETLFEGEAGVMEIDTIMKLGMAHPMGPLQLADFIGLDVCLFILRVMHEGHGKPKYAPCPLLVNMVEAGHLGVKSGNGFYQYSKDNKELIVSKQFL